MANVETILVVGGGVAGLTAATAFDPCPPCRPCRKFRPAIERSRPDFSVSPPKKGQEPRFSAAQGPLTLSENDPVRDPRPRRVIQRKAKQTAALRSTPTGLSERLGPVIFPPLKERDYGASSARMSSLNHERPIVRVASQPRKTDCSGGAI